MLRLKLSHIIIYCHLKYISSIKLNVNLDPDIILEILIVMSCMSMAF